MPKTRKITAKDANKVQKGYRLSQTTVDKIRAVQSKLAFTTETDALEFIVNAFTMDTDPTGLTEVQIQRVVDYVLPNVIEQLRAKFAPTDTEDTSEDTPED